MSGFRDIGVSQNAQVMRSLPVRGGGRLQYHAPHFPVEQRGVHAVHAVGAFAAASILATLAIVTLCVKVVLERQGAGRRNRPATLAGNESLSEVKP